VVRSAILTEVQLACAISKPYSNACDSRLKVVVKQYNVQVRTGKPDHEDSLKEGVDSFDRTCWASKEGLAGCLATLQQSFRPLSNLVLFASSPQKVDI
jgi:hypothetical protein